jgi:AcrR family transcriptional regulator
MRADARRNRERVLEAAEEVFGARGAAASTEEIARRAGVGIGTVFRHFPTKEALYEAIVVRRMSQLVEDAPLDSDDAGVAFREFFGRMVEVAATKKAFAESMAIVGSDVRKSTADVGEEIRRTFALLLERAQQAGAVRSDVSLPEVWILLAGACLSADHTMDAALRERALSVLFDGLRAR